MKTDILQSIKEKIESVEKKGHGEIIVKIKNGHVWRILSTEDELIIGLD